MAYDSRMTLTGILHAGPFIAAAAGLLTVHFRAYRKGGFYNRDGK